MFDSKLKAHWIVGSLSYTQSSASKVDILTGKLINLKVCVDKVISSATHFEISI